MSELIELSFDIRGNLHPYGKVETTIEVFETFFVRNFGEQRKAREEIFKEWKRYNNDLKELLDSPFTQWIDGSFVTNKITPKDIDIVSFINNEDYTKLEKEIDKQFSKWGVANFYEKIDAYTMWEYPQSHTFYSTYQADYLYWEEWFSHTKRNRAKKKFPKGFIELKST